MMAQPNLRWGSDDSASSILHIDMDAFFASVELLRRPQLIGRAVIVGGGTRSVVLSATYPARDFGVRSGMPMSQARALCPTATVIEPHHEAYREYSHQVMELLRRYTPLVEQVSVDEAFLDVSGSQRQFGSPLEIAEAIRTAVQTQLKLPCSVGIGPVKSIAKICSGLAKPQGIMLVSADQAVAFMHSLPVKSLWGVGPVTLAKLQRFGINQVRDLVAMDRQTLQAAVGKALAGKLLALANAQDARPVEVDTEEKSIGVERTFANDVSDRDQIYQQLVHLSDLCGQRARAKKVAGKVVSLKIRDLDFRTQTRSRTLDQATNSSFEIKQAAQELFAAWDAQRVAIRLLGVRLERLQPDGAQVAQPTLEEALTNRNQATALAEQAMDSIRARFGPSSVKFGGN